MDMGTIATPMTVTTIQLTVRTRDELRARGRKGDTYDDIIAHLLFSTRAENAAAIERGQRVAGSSPTPLFVHRDRE